MAETIDNPIITSPYELPSRHFVMGPNGPTGEIAPGRRPSESFIPIPQAKKGRGAVQQALDLSMGERTERNALTNELRVDVAKWRQRGYERTTAASRKLLNHWADPTRDNRVLFCQREAAETAIFLAEVSGRHGYRDWRVRLDDANIEQNSGLPRIALKMATGSGKTVVMAMLIAWQSINKAFAPRDARFSNRFLIIAPGITIRDRLRVLQPSDSGNYYDARDLIPADLNGALERVQIVITNYHAFLPRDSKEIRGVSATTRKVLLAGQKTDPFKETPDAVVSRVLRDFVSSRGELIVINDEAHHCYQDKPMMSGDISQEDKDANADARVWFKGIQAVARKIGVKQVYDLSATPFYLTGSGYTEGQLFSWTVSDFSLMDAIESGVVKIPRTPIDDDAAGDLVTYLHLWQHVGEELPKRKTKALTSGEWVMPDVLSGALRSLYQSYDETYRHWESELAQYGHTPPVFIVVCPNTVVSKLVYDWIAGYEAGDQAYVAGHLDRFSNFVDNRPLAMPRTILIDSAQLESGEALKGDFKTAAAEEISAFKAQYRIDHPGADAEKISDEDILREVMNTVGKPGMLGAGVRCVVSVQMLTEGWDANTVSHILGIRAFRSQLLCEQVVGRGLRRRSYDINDDGQFDPEYANIYGVPFSFIPTDRVVKDPKPLTPALEVRALEGRERYRIEFPRVDGYRIEMPDPDLIFDTDGLRKFPLAPDEVPTRTEVAGIVGPSENLVSVRGLVRRQEVVFHLANELLKRHFQSNGDAKPWHFRQLTRIVDQWIAECVVESAGRTIAELLRDETCYRACEEIMSAIAVQANPIRRRPRAVLRQFDPTGSTADVRFITRKRVVETEHSEVSHVVLDGIDGNTWEQIMAQECEAHKDIATYVKNDHLGFEIPYEHKGRSHRYVPDFIARLKTRDADDPVRYLIIEVSGGQKSPGPTHAKAETARNLWCPAINNHGGFGIWGYVEIADPVTSRLRLNEAIENLYANRAIIGDPDLLDFEERRGA